MQLKHPTNTNILEPQSLCKSYGHMAKCTGTDYVFFARAVYLLAGARAKTT